MDVDGRTFFARIGTADTTSTRSRETGEPKRPVLRIRAYDVAIAFAAIAEMGQAQTFHPDIPKAWDDAEVARFEMPLAQRDRSPRYMTAEEYYALKVRPIYRSYPMYAHGR